MDNIDVLASSPQIDSTRKGFEILHLALLCFWSFFNSAILVFCLLCLQPPNSDMGSTTAEVLALFPIQYLEVFKNAECAGFSLNESQIGCACVNFLYQAVA